MENEICIVSYFNIFRTMIKRKKSNKNKDQRRGKKSVSYIKGTPIILLLLLVILVAKFLHCFWQHKVRFIHSLKIVQFSGMLNVHCSVLYNTRIYTICGVQKFRKLSIPCLYTRLVDTQCEIS